jgi:phosphatidate phosphatase PAH1
MSREQAVHSVVGLPDVKLRFSDFYLRFSDFYLRRDNQGETRASIWVRLCGV